MSHRAEPGEIQSIVHDYVRREFLPDEGDAALTASTSLIGGGILSSIALVKLVSFLEERFDIRFSAYEISEDYLDSIEEIATRVSEKVAP